MTNHVFSVGFLALWNRIPSPRDSYSCHSTTVQKVIKMLLCSQIWDQDGHQTFVHFGQFVVRLALLLFQLAYCLLFGFFFFVCIYVFQSLLGVVWSPNQMNELMNKQQQNCSALEQIVLQVAWHFLKLYLHAVFIRILKLQVFPLSQKLKQMMWIRSMVPSLEVLKAKLNSHLSGIVCLGRGLDQKTSKSVPTYNCIISQYNIDL